MLMMTWFDTKFRPTRDLDFLGFGEAKPENVLAIFREICAVSQVDGVTFDVDADESSVTAKSLNMVAYG